MLVGVYEKMTEVEQLICVVKDAGSEIYKVLGAGYNEVIYEEAMAIEFRERGLKYDVEKNTEIFYKGKKVGIHRLDFILENKLVVELKAQSQITPSHVGQTRTYLKTLKMTNGIIVNFPYPDRKEPQFKQIHVV